MPGPPPTPTAVLKLRGSWRGIEREKNNEPAPPRGRPSCPKHLGAEGRAIWHKLIPMLDEMGVLSRIDAVVLARYCRLLVAFDKAAEFVDKVGITRFVKDANGNPTGEVDIYPQLDRMLTINDRLLRIEVQFGLTPSARARLTVLPKTEDAEIIESKEDFLQLG